MAFFKRMYVENLHYLCVKKYVVNNYIFLGIHIFKSKSRSMFHYYRKTCLSLKEKDSSSDVVLVYPENPSLDDPRVDIRAALSACTKSTAMARGKVLGRAALKLTPSDVTAPQRNRDCQGTCVLNI